MRESFTAGAQRAIRRAGQLARSRGGGAVEPIDLLSALVEEGESRASALLAELGVRVEGLLPGAVEEAEIPGEDEDERDFPPHSHELRLALSDAASKARELDRSQGVGTEHLLVGLLAAGGPVADRLSRAGLRAEALMERIARSIAVDPGPIPMSEDIPAPELADPGEADDLARILDASANRAREGLRVVEDYARFVLDDPGLTRRLKDVRHRLGEGIRGLDVDRLLTSRDTPGDVGTHIMAADEGARSNARAVLVANFKRTAEALRSLEEYTKITDQWLSGRFEVLRYDVYTIEKRMMAAVVARQGLGGARLYVLVGGLPTLGDLTWVVEEAIAGGADVIQYREKGLPDRVILHRAREVRILTAQAGVRFIMNDRPDLARLASADGVHLGQEDVSVRDARRVVGPNALIGVSTHEPAQLEAAIRDGANYLGVGPVFPSETKAFDALAGLAYVRHAAEATNLPWFAIGGVDESNLDQLLDAGASRVAVSSAVVRAERPRAAASALKARLVEAAG
ncbi:thiamine phosphate synthase [Tautonia plasticadhaerens]|uniref:Thiamine-phosphate synthase n=1 Tax=Tautonia plasticadhaerens TaxID=2527974 RepID=A0A518GZ93_9BACT|nr:thiamine phosphate synthase [Tautonia plasticadhaerens]QDV33915.1 Thiamine-phosphate synthase [Tautonia plasticadhaerens]